MTLEHGYRVGDMTGGTIGDLRQDDAHDDDETKGMAFDDATGEYLDLKEVTDAIIT